MTTVIRLLHVNPGQGPVEAIGQWVKDYDPDARDGLGEVFPTPDLAQAKRFATVREALKFYSQVSRVWPVRPDGKPNRPLTAFTVEFEHPPEDATS
jgi:hypothetical protein